MILDTLQNYCFYFAVAFCISKKWFSTINVCVFLKPLVAEITHIFADVHGGTLHLCLYMKFEKAPQRPSDTPQSALTTSRYLVAQSWHQKIHHHQNFG